MLLGVDVGGTFTDAVVFDGDHLSTAKAPTHARGPVRGRARRDRGGARARRRRPGDVETFAHGMTVGTNALLERRGARTALIATRGFADLLEIRRQNRPRLYHLCAPLPEPLVAPEDRVRGRRAGRPRRRGRASRPAELDRIASEVAELGVESIAICLLFSYLRPGARARDRRAPARAPPRGPRLRLVRGAPAVPRVRALLDHGHRRLPLPLLDRYLGRLGEAAAERGPARARGDALLGRASRRPARPRAPGAWSVLSGPAGGAVGAGLLARLVGRRQRARLRHGRHLLRRLRDRGRPGAQDRLARDRRPRRSSCRWSTCTRSAPAAARSAGATPAAPCGSGRARRAPSRGPPATAAAAPSRRSPTPTSLLGYLAPDSTLAGGVALDADAARRAVARSRDELGLERARGGRGHRAGREPGDGPGAARRHRRARRRPARLRADALRRRRPDARGRARGGARDRRASSARGPAASSRRSACSPPSAGATPRARCCCAATSSPPSASPRRSARSASRCADGLEDADARGHLRAALPRPVVRAPGRRRRPPGPRAARRGLRAPSTSAATATATPRAEVELVNVRLALRRARPGAARRGAAGEGGLTAGERRARFAGEWLEAEVLRGEPPAGLPRPRARACSSCPRRPWCCRPAGARRSTRRARSGGARQ